MQQQQQRQPTPFDHSTAKSQSPVQLAQSWAKPIWTTEYALRFLEKITNFIRVDPRNRHHSIGVGVVGGGGGGGNASPNVFGIVSSKTRNSHQASFASTTAATGVGGALIGHGAAKSRTANAKHLNGDYIKIESTQKHYRPYYQEIKCWPTLNLNGTDGYCPFQVASDKAKLTNTIDNANKNNNNNSNNNNKQQTTKALKRRGEAVENITKLGNRQTSGVHGATAVAAGTFVSAAADLKHHSLRSAALNVKSHLQINDSNQSTMTRKTRNKRDSTTVDGCSVKATTVTNDIIKRTSDKCGYCEKCRVEYESLSLHLQSTEHLNFVKNSDNYLALDSLINSGANVETFLKMNSSSRSPQKQTATSPTSTKSASPIDPIATTESNGQLTTTTTATGNHINHHHNERTRKNINHQQESHSHQQQHSFAIGENALQSVIIGERSRCDPLVNGNSVDYDHDDAPLSPKSISVSRDKLPKYSPPMTRRSQNKTNKALTTAKRVSDDTNRGKVAEDEQDDHDDSPNLRKILTTFCSAASSQQPPPATDGCRRRVVVNGEYESTVNESSKRDETKARVEDDSPPVKRLFRAFPRYKVIDGIKSLTKNNLASMTSAMETPTTTTTTTTATAPSITNDCEDSTSVDLQSENDRHKDPTTGIIVKFKRVRESELSKLTYEADNFMFPKQRDDQPTDDDRQTTSERGLVDVTSDIVSSELDEARLASPTRKPTTLSDESDQFTSSGRRKKRRTQYDSFMAETTRTTKKKKQSSTEDVRPNETTAPAASSQRPAKVTRRSTKSAKAAAEASNSEPTNAFDSDGKYNGGSILSTDFFKTLKFSFERVPTNEPWYLTFQRQDECRERIFEYWGNTGTTFTFFLFFS